MGKKNSQIHLVLETDLLEALKREARERNNSISEVCREKLRESSQLTRIEILLETLLKGGADFGRAKSRQNPRS